MMGVPGVLVSTMAMLLTSLLVRVSLAKVHVSLSVGLLAGEPGTPGPRR